MNKLAIDGGAPVRTKSWPKWPQWDERERQQILEVLESGEWGGFNPAVREFECAFAGLHAAKYCFAAVNGTLTLEAALRVVGVGVGDEVIVPTFTFFATAGTVVRSGAKPVFCDIEPESFNAGAAEIEKHISPRTRAIMPVHLYGQLTNLRSIESLAAKRGEDFL